MFYFVDGNGKSAKEIVMEMEEKKQQKRKRKEVNGKSSLLGYTPRRSRLDMNSFPNVDRCDSILDFPAAFVTCINTGDFTSLEKLMHSRINAQCVVSVGKLEHTNIATVVRVFALLDEVHPDRVTCVHATRVVKQQIRTKINFKFTESRALRNVIESAASERDRTLLALFPAPQKNIEKVMKFLDKQTEQEQKEFFELVNSADEFMVFGNAYMILTFDPFTKNITRMRIKCEYRSFRPMPEIKAR